MINWILGVSLIAMGVVLGFTLGCAYTGRSKAEFSYNWTCGLCMMRFEISTNDFQTIHIIRDKHLKTHGNLTTPT